MGWGGSMYVKEESLDVSAMLIFNTLDTQRLHS